MAFYFALFNVANANQELRDHHQFRRQSNAQNIGEDHTKGRRRHSVSSSSSSRSFFSDFRQLPKPKIMSASVNQKGVCNDVHTHKEQCPQNSTEIRQNRLLSSPTPTSSPAASSQPCNMTPMHMSASARFHHNTEESLIQTPCCSPILENSQRQVQEAERPMSLKHTPPFTAAKVNHSGENKITSPPTSNRPQNAAFTPPSKKVTFMSVNASNEYFEKAKKKRQRRLSAENIGNFLDLGDLAAWNMKAVIVPRRKPHRHAADPVLHKEPFIEIPSNKALKNPAQTQEHLLRRGSAAAEIRLPDRQERRTSAQADQYCGVGSVAAKILTSSNNNHLPQSPRVAKVQRSRSSRTADTVEMASIKAWRALRRQRRNSAEEKLAEKERKAFGNDLKPICYSPSQRQLQAELRGHTPQWQEQGMDTSSRESRRQKSIIRRRSTSDQHSFTEGRRRNSEEVQWKILHNYIQRGPKDKGRTKDCVALTSNHNKACCEQNICCEVCGEIMDAANGNYNVSRVAQQIGIIPRQAISIAAPEAMPLMRGA